MKTSIAGLASALLLSTAAWADGATAYVVNIENGATVSSPVKVVFGLSGKGVAPAGVEQEGTGHHHVLLNRPAYGDVADDVEMLEFGIPADDNHMHFGGGQTEVVLDLPAGQHTVQLLLGDHNHVPHDPAVVSEVVTFTVVD